MRIPSSVVAIFLLFFNCTNTVENDENDNEIDSLRVRTEQLETENDSLKRALRLMKSEKIRKFPASFNEIEKPEELIFNALEKRPDLIPKDAVLGGQMRFINYEILNDKFIWAEYEDGHINGKAIYEYHLNENGEMKFKLLTQLGE